MRGGVYMMGSPKKNGVCCTTGEPNKNSCRDSDGQMIRGSVRTIEMRELTTVGLSQMMM